MLEVHFADQPSILARHYRSLGTTTAREEELIRFSHGPHSKLAMPTGAARYCLMTAPGQTEKDRHRRSISAEPPIAEMFAGTLAQPVRATCGHCLT
jgi:hypothetical protein